MSRLDELIKEMCPDGVEYKRLGELGKFYGGLTGKSKEDFKDGNAIFITYKNIYSNPALDLKPVERVKISEGERQRVLQYGDIIFTGSSETPDECGMSSVVTEVPIENLYLNSFCFFFRFDDVSIMKPEFAKHLFRTTNLRCQISRTANGVTRFNISKEKMAKIVIPVPPLEIQEEIAEILDKFTDHVTELQDKLQAELQARRQQYDYYFKHVFGIFDFPKVKLGEIGIVKMCKRILKAQTSTEGDVPFYKIGTFGKQADAFINKDLYEEYKKKYSYPKTGDVLISCSGTIGRTVVYDGTPAYFQDSNIVWLEHDGSRVSNEFLRYAYKTNPWLISAGGTISRLYNDGILRAEIPLPTLEQQKEIVEMLDRFENICDDINSCLPAEIEARQKQYEYYRDKLLTFKGLEVQ